MTTAVIVLVNGPAYEATVKTIDGQGKTTSEVKAKGGSYAQAWVGPGQRVEVTEAQVETDPAA